MDGYKKTFISNIQIDSKVQFTGYIVSIQKWNTNNTYLIDDSSGKF